MEKKNDKSFERLTIRTGEPRDVPVILRFIKELAEYEGIGNRVTATERGLMKTLFGDAPAAETAVAMVDGEPVGFAVFYHTFSTILGKRGLHLDDLYISPQWRGKGLGTAMLRWLARLAVERDCGRFEWWCMKDNAPALEFYERIGAMKHDEVFILRMQGETIASFAEGRKVTLSGEN
ncbi:MAG: GNAT family N-acetyltransferase [Thermovirgaceae bacterium]|nr:GNAT family N-acetyltransferase [Synergistales bacterium]MDI9391643.1 GNAT family N-acetyltransferase [Synergistota bacterium]MDY0179529.1 GNAT family N-acetyltransferase [Synergistaceae bacterium]HRW86891.1 GNAT family N-acetyltransferase [Thermovirgaceae bacterium]MDD3134445.1 GNAT family N-acetyltransferase [Synergistales bacterium]